MASMRTYRVLDTKTIQLCFRKTTPHLWFIHFIGIIKTTINRDDVFNKDIDGLSMLFILLVDREGFLVQAMLNSDPGNFTSIVVLELVDITYDFPFVRPDGGEEKQILEVLVVTERRGLDDDLFKQFNKLDGEISCQECLDGDGNVVGICALGKSSGRDLRHY